MRSRWRFQALCLRRPHTSASRRPESKPEPQLMRGAVVHTSIAPWSKTACYNWQGRRDTNYGGIIQKVWHGGSQYQVPNPPARKKGGWPTTRNRPLGGWGFPAMCSNYSRGQTDTAFLLWLGACPAGCRNLAPSPVWSLDPAATRKRRILSQPVMRCTMCTVTPVTALNRQAGEH
jgi:hypothetical protein